MLEQMRPELRHGRYVFTTATAPLAATVHPVMTFTEDEGLTSVLTQDEADTLGLSYGPVLAWITLRVTSALDGVGLTAAVSGVLADAGIACNVVAAAFHDHLFVPAADADRAVSVLEALSGPGTRPS